MAIGSAIGAVVGGVATGVGSILGGSSANKAASKAADTSLAVAEKNNALAREIYSNNEGYLSPYVGRGDAAGSTMNALLGLGAYQAPQQQASAQFNTEGLAPGTAAPAFDYRRVVGGYAPGGTYVGDQGQGLPTQQAATPMAATGAATTGTAIDPQTAANNAFDIFRNSTGYQFRLGEGMDAINSGYAGAGTLQSGAAMKAINDYGQNMASQEFGNYMGYLGNQQGVGLGAGSALAGVGQNYVNTISQNNNNAGTAVANSQLARTNPFANALGTIGGGLLGGF